MKTLQDLFALILTEKELNNGKQFHYLGTIDLKYNWVSFGVYEESDNGLMEDGRSFEKDNASMRHMSIDTEAQLQQVYWTIYNFGRSKNQ